MLNLRRFTLLSCTVAALLGGTMGSDRASAAPTEPAPTYYSLSCRGGLDLKFDKVFAPNVDPLLVLTMFFRKSGSKASTSMPAGTCAWSDRAVSANEPTYIQFSGRSDDDRLLIAEISSCMRDPNCIVVTQAAVVAPGGLKGNLNSQVMFKRGT